MLDQNYRFRNHRILGLLRRKLSSHQTLHLYLIGSNWWKRDNNELIHLVWFREGNDIFNSQIRGYYSGRSFIREELGIKSTGVKRHFHVFVRKSEYIKNTKHGFFDYRNDISTLIELQLIRIFNEFNSKNERTLDVKIENNHH